LVTLEYGVLALVVLAATEAYNRSMKSKSYHKYIVVPLCGLTFVQVAKAECFIVGIDDNGENIVECVEDRGDHHHFDNDRKHDHHWHDGRHWHDDHRVPGPNRGGVSDFGVYGSTTGPTPWNAAGDTPSNAGGRGINPRDQGNSRRH